MSDWNVAPVDDTLLRQTPRVTDDDLPAGARQALNDAERDVKQFASTVLRYEVGDDGLREREGYADMLRQYTVEFIVAAEPFLRATHVGRRLRDDVRLATTPTGDTLDGLAAYRNLDETPPPDVSQAARRWLTSYLTEASGLPDMLGDPPDDDASKLIE